MICGNVAFVLCVCEVVCEMVKKEKVKPSTATATKTPDEKSRRQQKRERKQEHLKVQRLQKEKSQKSGVKMYLKTWKKNRDQWKFEKLKQNWILDNLFDDTQVSDKLWPTVLQYFQESRGNVRKVLNERCVKFVDELKQADGDKVAAEDKSRRALEILQLLGDDDDDDDGQSC